MKYNETYCELSAVLLEGMPMLPCDAKPVDAAADTRLERGLRVLAVVTMLMTVPQVLAVWRSDGAPGASLLSWVTYLVSSAAWLVYGLRKGDKTLWVTCIGWIALDAAIIAGIVARSPTLASALW